jgi:hypothetical protein
MPLAIVHVVGLKDSVAMMPSWASCRPVETHVVIKRLEGPERPV